MTMGSLFDGIGAFPLAASRFGIKPIWASEIEPSCLSVTKRHFPRMKHLGDITKISGAGIKPVDIITFGSPCQDLSIAGKREGLQGSRSNLFMEAARVIKEMRGKYGKPDYIVWENVPGAFSANGGKDFQTVIEEIARIAGTGISIPRPKKWLAAGTVMGDCWSLAWRVLDARYWGVPQCRKRIFLVADFRGQSAPEILFKPGGLPWDSAEGKEAGEEAPASAERGFRKAVGIDGYNQNLLPSYCIQGNTIGRSDNAGAAGKGVNKDVSFTLNTVDRHAVFKFQSFGQYKQSDKSKTLMACDDITTGDLVMDCFKVRRLTPLECERLMGFPDGWSELGHDNKPLSDTARYRALGNSIAVPCAEFIVGRIGHGAY